MKRHIDKIEGAVYERGYVYNFHFHRIFVTKYRRKVFTTPQLAAEMKELICKCAKAGDFDIETLEVMPDHVHLLISFKPRYAPTDIVKYIKGYTAREFFKVHPDTKKQDFWGGHLWSNSYFMSTLGNMSKDVVKQYIENQYVKTENKSANSSRG